MSNIAKNKAHYIETWNAHIAQLNTLAFQAGISPYGDATMATLYSWVLTSADSTYKEEEKAA